jgi:hypothetical protein
VVIADFHVHSNDPTAAAPSSTCPRPTPTRTGWAAPRGPFPQPPAPPRPDGPAAVYRRRDPTATPLYPLVQHHLETFLADTAAADPDGQGIPRWVEDDFRAYLRCGILAHGFARIRCDACAAERLMVQVALNTRVSFNTFAQYSNVADLATFNARFRYHFREGTDLWIVYNDGFNAARDIAGQPRLPLSAGRTLLLKYTHTLIF